MARRIAPSTSPDARSWPRLMLLVEAFEHAAGLLDGVARAVERDVIAALLGDDAEPALDQRQVLAVLAEQHGGVAVVVEGEHDLGRRRCPAAGTSPWPGPSGRNGIRLLLLPRAPARRAARAFASAPNRLLVLTSVIGHRRDLADQGCRRHRPAPAADRASGRRSGPDGGRASRTARRSVMPTQRAMNAAWLPVDVVLQALQALVLHGLRRPDRPCRRPACRAAANI